MRHVLAAIPIARSRPSARRGSVLVYTTLCMFTLSGVGALAFDMARLRACKGELQAAADAAALNAANGLGDNTYFAKAQAAANQNTCNGTAVTLTAANVVPGNWTSETFTANGLPRNAVRIVASRTAAGGNAIQSTLGNLIGRPSADVQARATVALIKQADYEWTGLDATSLTAGNNAFKVSSYDATNGGAPELKTTVKSNGKITVNGPATINADVKYGTTASIANGATVNGVIAKNAKPLEYPPGSQVANISGTPAYQTTSDLNVSGNMTLGGGTYIIKNCNVSNGVITFTGPATIVLSGNLNMTNCGFATSGNLPANLKIISTATDTAISISGLTRTLNCDFYAPGSTLAMTAGSGAFGLSGRGVFKSINVTGTGAASSMMYDRSLTDASLSQKAVVVD